jgi:hypothetical protein
MVSESSELKRSLLTPTLPARAIVTHRMIRNIAIKSPKARAWTLSGSASLPLTTTPSSVIVNRSPVNQYL